MDKKSTVKNESLEVHGDIITPSKNGYEKDHRLNILRDRRLMHNVVDRDEMRIIQSRTLNTLEDILSKSFGPYGSNSVISKIIGDGSMLAPSHYTKDGHTILKNIIFQDVIEMSTKDAIEDITRSIVTKVGDGTTSAVILSSIIFDALTELENNNMIPYEIIKDFNKAVDNISKVILDNAQEFTWEDAYDIAHVSTNGNDELSTIISDLYKQYGNDVHIELDTSPDKEHIIREYEGIVYNDGYMDSRFINTKDTGKSEIYKPEIYIFLDPINNQVIGAPFIQILSNNIVQHIKEGGDPSKIKDTVIIAPSISIDFASYVDSIMEYYNMYNIPSNLLIITGVARDDSLNDIAIMTGAKLIRKYIDPEKYKEDVEKGLAANATNVHTFAGYSEVVKADHMKTMFINPKNQLNEDGTPSNIYTNLIESLKAELKNAESESGDTTHKYQLKRRIRSLTSSNIDFLVGGISQLDRENTRDLLDDAIKNCKSAAEYGYGQGANVEGFLAAKSLYNQADDGLKYMYNIIQGAYEDTIYTLLSTSGLDYDNIEYIIQNIIESREAYNIRTKEYDGKVKTSIMSDPNILEAISQIVTRMVTANQFICPDIHYNRYMG